MSKVTVVGAGNVGATCANVLAFNEVADEVVMLDVMGKINAYAPLTIRVLAGCRQTSQNKRKSAV